MNRQQRAIAIAVLPPPVKSTTEKERKSNSFHRMFPLLLLTLYALASVVRLACSSPFPSSFVQASASSSTFSAESRQESESLKTHVPSETHHLEAYEENPVAAAPPCSSFIDGTAASTDEAAAAFVCCDRSHIRSDLCYARGDIRTDFASSSVLVYGLKSSAERIRPYTRKWDATITRTIQEISIRPGNGSGGSQKGCDVRHEGVPALLFSNGGYTGNLYHEFSDGLIPLYVTAQRFRGEVVLVVAEYRPWWFARYRPLLERLTNYQVVDFRRDRRVHCFSEMIVGLRIHGELIIDPWLMPNGSRSRRLQRRGPVEALAAGRGVPTVPPTPGPVHSPRTARPVLSLPAAEDRGVRAQTQPGAGEPAGAGAGVPANRVRCPNHRAQAGHSLGRDPPRPRPRRRHARRPRRRRDALPLHAPVVGAHTGGAAGAGEAGRGVLRRTGSAAGDGVRSLQYHARGEHLVEALRSAQPRPGQHQPHHQQGMAGDEEDLP
ncbi:uncharacterized protein LOC141838247 isoform X2 [Curcuma longa]|uniref:uncharacterized protein LOC141838247 isoform X2 n=1 Tax=Curcuma longa TaxID=136217 RepID=UPI003D9F8D16